MIFAIIVDWMGSIKNIQNATPPAVHPCDVDSYADLTRL